MRCVLKLVGLFRCNTVRTCLIIAYKACNIRQEAILLLPVPRHFYPRQRDIDSISLTNIKCKIMLSWGDRSFVWCTKACNERTFTRILRASSLTEHNKSALTDHATQENHVTNWSQATVIDREPQHFTRWIKETIHIRKEGQQAMNRDEVSYQLSHAYDRFLDTASSRRIKNRKNWVPASSDEGLW